MKMQVLKESGYDVALFGLGFSRGITSEMEFSEFIGKGEGWASSEYVQMRISAQRLACKDGGHNKFLESIVVWLDITAPRYWWQQFDTYRVGVTKQSESTMHTLTKRRLTQADFAGYVNQDIIDAVNGQIDANNLDMAKAWLPESFRQRRIVCTNYKALRNIYQQRRGHKLEEWHVFCDALEIQLMYPEFLQEAR